MSPNYHAQHKGAGLQSSTNWIEWLQRQAHELTSGEVGVRYSVVNHDMQAIIIRLFAKIESRLLFDSWWWYVTNW